VNKSQLVEALAAHYEGNKKAAAKALDAVVDTITREVGRGEKVAITGFGAFEKAMRQEKAVPHFRPGANLRGVVEGVRSLPGLTLSTAANAAAAVTETAARATGLGGRKKPAAKSETATRKTPGTKATTQPAATADFEPPAQKEAAVKKAGAKAPAKKAPAKKTTAKQAPAATPAKNAPAEKTAADAPAAKAPARKAPAKKAPAKKAPARTAPSKKAAATAPAKAAAKKAAAKKAPAKKAPAATTSAPAPTPAALADPPVPDTSSRPVLSVGPDTDAGTTPASSPAEASQPGQS
jgi:DNA-binding protein HU-beta